MKRDLLELNDVKVRIGVLAEIVHQTDRACATVAGSVLESQLEKLLRKNMVLEPPKELFSPYGPLATFASKIDTAFAMGLISKNERADLHKIRQIRNIFAHSLEMGLCFKSPAVMPYLRTVQFSRSKITGCKTSERKEFESCVYVLLGFILGKIDRAKHVKSPTDLIDHMKGNRKQREDKANKTNE